MIKVLPADQQYGAFYPLTIVLTDWIYIALNLYKYPFEFHPAYSEGTLVCKITPSGTSRRKEMRDKTGEERKWKSDGWENMTKL